MKREYIVYLVKVTFLFIIYYLTAKFGLKLDAVSGFATLVWLPTGISLATLFVFGLNLWPGIFLGAFLANYMNHAPVMVALGISLGNTLEALIGVYFLRRFVDFKASFDRLRDVIGLILIAAVFSTMISATVGVASLLAGHVISSSAFKSTWIAWWVGDMLSDLVIAPLIFLWTAEYTIHFRWSRIIEGALITLLFILIGLIVFNGLFGIEIKNSSLTYIVFPPLIWITLRFKQREAASATVLLSTIAILGTIRGLGPFARPMVNESLLFLQSFMGVISVTTLILAVVVAERKRLEQQKDNFISIASHELKTPVTSIKAFCQLLKKRFTKAGDKNSAELLGKMDTQISKLNSLISDLLDVTKIEAGKLHFNREIFDFDQLVTEIIEEMRRTTDKHKIIKKGSRVKEIYADRERIGEVIINLLSNAIKYSPDANSVIVTSKTNQNTVSLCVQDFGIGISKERQPHIFERFFRGSDQKSSTFPGLGLGLYISSEIIKREGGRMDFTSEKGKGSTFCFTLPIKGSGKKN